MTVRELIEELKKRPPDATVWFETANVRKARTYQAWRVARVDRSISDTCTLSDESSRAAGASTVTGMG